MHEACRNFNELQGGPGTVNKSSWQQSFASHPPCKLAPQSSARFPPGENKIREAAASPFGHECIGVPCKDQALAVKVPLGFEVCAPHIAGRLNPFVAA